MKVIFRTDASLNIGTGHVMRCLTLADALSERGAECRFVCREHPGNLLGLIRERGFEAAALPLPADTVLHSVQPDEQPPVHAAWLGADWRSDAEAMRAALGESQVEWLIVDHYALDARWETALRPHCRKLMVIDDLADRPHDCDLLLDQNLVADRSHRYYGRVPTHCGLMLGPEYALLQSQYAELHPRVPPREGPVRRVLVYFGGADSNNMTGMAIAAFLSFDREDVALDVVINPESPHAGAIRRQVEGQQHIMLHAGLPSLAPLIVQADLAIGAGGATSWERCCLGLPSLVITLAENQKPIAAELDLQGLIRWLGHQGEISEDMLAQALKEIIDAGLTPAWSEDCQRLVDGRGAERVCSMLMLNAQTPLQARLARLDDEALILQWANEPLVRQNAFATGAIDPAIHRAWFRSRLRDLENCRLYIMETQDGFLVGQVRFERSGEAWEIDYALDARARGREIGKTLLHTAMLALRANLSETTLLVGRVKISNTASQKVFESLGFHGENSDDQVCIYRYVLQ